jgi:hypothetical protein
MSEQTPDGAPPIEPATPPTEPAPPAPDTETLRTPWEAVPPTPGTPSRPEPAPSPDAPGWVAPDTTPAAPGWGTQTNPPSGAPPEGAAVTWATAAPRVTADVPGAPGLVYADTVSRFIAWVIDGFILLLVVGIVAGILAAIVGGGTRAADRTTTNLVSNLVFVVASLAYSVFFWTGGRRATPGQMLFKIQVGNAFDGQPLSITQAVKRWIGLGWFFSAFAVIPSIGGLTGLLGFVWYVALLVTTVRSPVKQGFHDRWANSALVRPRDSSSSGWATACLIILIVVGLVFVVSIIGLIFLGSQVSDILSKIGSSV